MRILRIFRNGKRHERITYKQIPAGAKGNLETLAVMKQIVLEDIQEKDFGNFINQVLIGNNKGSLSEKISAAFLFCRDQIIYDQEKDGYETVADLWSCLYALNDSHALGDCAVKSVALATILSFLGLRPSFVAIGQIENVDYFNHVFVSCEINGVETPLDPTPPQFRLGDELESLRRIVYPIF